MSDGLFKQTIRLKKQSKNYYLIPEEILNDRKLSLVSPAYGGFTWFDLKTFQLWFWNSETGEKYPVTLKEAEG